MKGCDAYSRGISRYLDRELYGQELLQFRTHLVDCAACSQEIEAEEELSRLLHRSQPLYAAPTALRDRVLSAIGEAAPGPLRGLRPNERGK
jgi:mycothiol system anti-sigma-R factor